MIVRIWTQEIRVVGDVGILELSHPDGRWGEHLFDADLVPEVEKHNWYEGKGYAMSGQPPLYLHWLAFEFGASGPPVGQEVDHISRDRSDSRASNLRVVSRRINKHNRTNPSSISTCISYDASRRSFEVRVAFARKRPYAPSFRTLLEAEVCRDAFLRIATEYDAGLRFAPTHEELVKIAHPTWRAR